MMGIGPQRRYRWKKPRASCHMRARSSTIDLRVEVAVRDVQYGAKPYTNLLECLMFDMAPSAYLHSPSM